MDPTSFNYNPEAEWDVFDECIYEGCPDSTACNYAPDATLLNVDLCVYADSVFWCCDENPQNGLCDANQIFISSCVNPGQDPYSEHYDECNFIEVTSNNNSEIFGCTDNSAYLDGDPSSILASGLKCVKW